MPINLFDCFLVAFLIAGVLRGRKHGGSEEFLRVLKWLCLVGVCALAYQPLGAAISSSGLFDPVSAAVLAYLSVALVIILLFSPLQQRLGRKLTGSDTFGRTEYYLGMGSGFVRYACILVAALALLNARVFTQADLKEMEKYQMDAYGSTVFPTLRSVQELVFDDSLTGGCIKQNLGFLLIHAAPSEPVETAPAKTSPPARQVTQAHRGT